MSESAELAARLRQAIQGCSIHSHGPIQAWAAIEQARADGKVDALEVAKIAMEACRGRIRDLEADGASSADLRIKKEQLTLAFIEKLFG